MNNKLTEHVKFVCNQNDQIFTTMNKFESNLIQHTDHLLKIENDINTLKNGLTSQHQFDEVITMKELNDVVDDVKQSFEYVLLLNLTPRHSDEIKNLMNEITLLKNMLNNLTETVNNFVPNCEAEIVEPLQKKNVTKLNLKTESRNMLAKDIILTKK